MKDTQISIYKDYGYQLFRNSRLVKSNFIILYKNKIGHFVVTTCVVGENGTPLRSSYAASKHALHGFFDGLRAEHHQDNIVVTLVCPSFVNTNVSKNALTGNGTPQQKMDAATANGMNPKHFVRLMVKAIRSKKEKVYIAEAKENLASMAYAFIRSY